MTPELKALLTKGREAYQRTDLVGAERALTEALSHGAQDFADVHHMLGVIYHSWGLYTKAHHAFEAALRINPHYTEAALNLAIAYNDLGRYAEAQEVLDGVLRGQERAEESLTHAKIANLHAQVGDAYRTAGYADEAVTEYRRALALCGRFADIRKRLAQALIEQGKQSEAIAELRRATADNPHYTPALLELGLLLMGQGDGGGARAAFEAVLRIDPQSERATSYLRVLESGATTS